MPGIVKTGIFKSMENFATGMEKFAGVSPLLMEEQGVKIDHGEEETKISVDLPGAVKEKIDVTIDGARISVEAHTTTGKAIRKNIFLREEIDEKLVKATYSNGVLTIKLTPIKKKKVKVVFE